MRKYVKEKVVMKNVLESISCDECCNDIEEGDEISVFMYFYGDESPDEQDFCSVECFQRYYEDMKITGCDSEAEKSRYVIRKIPARFILK